MPATDPPTAAPEHPRRNDGHTCVAPRAGERRRPAPVELDKAVGPSARRRVGRPHTAAPPPPRPRSATCRPVPPARPRCGGRACRVPASSKPIRQRGSPSGPAHVHDDKRAVDHVELPLVEEQDGGTLLDRNGSRRRQARDGSLGHGYARRISIRPQPNARARPKPAARAERNAAGSVTVKLPVNSTRLNRTGRCMSRGTRIVS